MKLIYWLKSRKIFHKCSKHLIFCGLGEFYWCKKCKKEFDYLLIEGKK